MGVYYSAVCHERKQFFYSGDIDDDASVKNYGLYNLAFCRAVVFALVNFPGKWEIVGDFYDREGYEDLASEIAEAITKDYPGKPTWDQPDA